MINSQTLFTAEYHSQKNLLSQDITHDRKRCVLTGIRVAKAWDNQLTEMKEKKERNTATSKISKVPS